MSRHGQCFSDLAIAKNLQHIVAIVRQRLLFEGRRRDFGTSFESPLKICNIDFTHERSKFVEEASFGNTTDHRHGSTLKGGMLRVTGARTLSLVATSRGFTQARTCTASNTLTILVLVNAFIDIV